MVTRNYVAQLRLCIFESRRILKVHLPINRNFVPDQKAHLVCQPDHCFVMRIMRQPNKICAQLFRPGEQSAIVLLREGAAATEWRFLVEANAAKKDWLAVQQDLCAASFDGAK